VKKLVKRVLLDLFIPVKLKTTGSGEDYKEYKSEICSFILSQKKLVKRVNCDLSITIKFYVNNFRGDIDNLIKPVLDSINMADIIGDDSQFRRIKAEIIDDVFEYGMSLRICRMGGLYERHRII